MNRPVQFRHGLTHVGSNVWSFETAMLKVWNDYCEHAIEISAQVRPNLCKARPETHGSSQPPRIRNLSRRKKRVARDIAKAAMHGVWDEYCPHGIETEAQERYLYDLAARVCTVESQCTDNDHAH